MMKGLPSSISLARDAFVAALRSDSAGDAEHGRLVAVLDALLTWSLARPTQVVHRPAERPNGTLCFEDAGSKRVIWSARVVRGEGAKLELSPPYGRALSPDMRETVLQALNSHSRVVLQDGDPLRISFTALKNAKGRAAVLALMDQLLQPETQKAATPDVPATTSV